MTDPHSVGQLADVIKRRAISSTPDINDAIADAARTGVPCHNRLDPPPADPRVAHSFQ